MLAGSIPFFGVQTIVLANEQSTPTQIDLETSRTVRSILTQAGFVRVTSTFNPNNPPPAYFRVIACNMHGGMNVYSVTAPNKYEHHLGLSQADIQLLIDGFTAADIQAMASLGQFNNDYEAMFAVVIFNTYGPVRGQQILADLNWSHTSLGELSDRLNQIGTSLGAMTQEQERMFAAQQQMLLTFSVMRSGSYSRNPNLHGPPVAGNVKVFSPANPGPLPADVANTFRGGTYRQVTLTQDTVFYRVHGGSAGKVGRFMTRTPQRGGFQSQIDLALDPGWGNTAQNVTRVVVPKGTVIFEGAAAGQTIHGGAGRLIGGGNQVYIPEVNPSWFGR